MESSSSGQNIKVPNILKEGYLLKRSLKKTYGAYWWQKRYFVLDDAYNLSYFSDPEGFLKAQIVLAHDAIIELSAEKPHAFRVQTNFVSILMAAESDVERDVWMNSLKASIQKQGLKKKKENWNRIRTQAKKQREAKATGRGTHTFQASGQAFEVDSRYEYIRPVGRGAYGLVVAAKDTIEKKDVAIKKISKVFDNVIDGKRILREITILRHLRHRNISHVIDLMRETPSSGENSNDVFDTVYIVSDLMDTDLHRVIYSTQKLEDTHIKFILFQLLHACYFLESAGVIHRDLKPSNILVNSNCELRVCDFGLARGSEDSADDITVYVVTRWYRAPELLLSSPDYSFPIDIWSVGCIFAELLGRKPLFTGDDYLKQLGLVFDILGTPTEEDMEFLQDTPSARFVRDLEKKPKVPWNQVPQLANASSEALDLLDVLLTFNPNKRLTAQEAIDHPYLSAYKSQPLSLRDSILEMDDLESKKMTKAELRAAVMKEINCYRTYDSIPAGPIPASSSIISNDEGEGVASPVS